MSDGGMGGGWTQSAAPFSGLTATDLSAARNRQALHRAIRGSVRPDELRSPRRKRRMDGPQRIPSMTKVYEEMLEALRTSVLEIVAANPADATAKLTKSFEGFESALAKRLSEDLPLPIGEADPVSLLGDRVAMLDEAISAIEGGLVRGGEHLSEDSMMLAKGIVEFGGLALHACAADFAEPVEEGEEIEEGFGLYKVATTEGEVLIKSVLPEQAAVLTADKADTAEKLVEFFLEGLDWLGVPVTLAKKAPPPFAKKGQASAEGEDEEDSDEGEAEAEEGDEGEEGEFGDEGDEGEEGEGEGGSPLENVARLASLALLELDAIKGQIGPGAEGEDPDGSLSALDAIGQHLALTVVQADALNGAVMGAEEDPAAMDPNAMGADQGEMPAGEGEEGPLPEEEEAEKAVGAGGLAKGRAIAADILAKADAAESRAAQAEARAAAAEAEAERLRKAAGAKPADPKAATGVGATVLTKTQDSGGIGQETEAERFARLQKMAPEEAANELIKGAFRHPIRVA